MSSGDLYRRQAALLIRTLPHVAPAKCSARLSSIRASYLLTLPSTLPPPIRQKGEQMFPIPQCVFLTRGVGVHRHQLTAFEFALRDADIEQQNLVHVSSILPPRCEVITREAGEKLLRPGDITFCVLARSETNELGRRVYASLGLARPADADMYGYISELHGYG